MSLDFGDAEQSRYCNSQGIEIVGYDVFDDVFVDVEVFMNEENSLISRRIADTAMSECSPLSAGRWA